MIEARVFSIYCIDAKVNVLCCTRRLLLLIIYIIYIYIYEKKYTHRLKSKRFCLH